MTTRAELEQEYAKLRAQAVGPLMHSEELGRRMAVVVGKIESLPPEPVEAPEVIHTEHSLEEAQAMLEAMTTPNEHLAASIKEARASLDNGNLHVNEPAEPEPLPDFLAAIGATP